MVRLCAIAGEFPLLTKRTFYPVIHSEPEFPCQLQIRCRFFTDELLCRLKTMANRIFPIFNRRVEPATTNYRDPHFRLKVQCSCGPVQ